MPKVLEFPGPVLEFGIPTLFGFDGGGRAMTGQDEKVFFAGQDFIANGLDHEFTTMAGRRCPDAAGRKYISGKHIWADSINTAVG